LGGAPRAIALGSSHWCRATPHRGRGGPFTTEGREDVFMSAKLFLIDGHSQVFQAYYALGRLTSPKGLPVNAVFGFVGMFQRLLREQKPDYLAVVFDREGPTFRHQEYKEYKATRKPTPEDLIPQVPVIEEILRAYGVPIYGVSGYEADDVIATIAKRAAADGLDVYIVTTDKDAQQLIGPHIKVLNVRKDQVLDLEWLKKERGLTPEQVVEVMALEGDHVDNIPGVPGVGEKTALELIHEWGTLENLLANAEKVKRPKLRENLIRALTWRASANGWSSWTRRRRSSST